MKRDFLHITDYSKEEFWDFIDKASWIKNKIYNIERFDNFLTNCNIKITDINYNELTINDLHSRINQLDKYHDTCGNYLLIDKNDERIKTIN